MNISIKLATGKEVELTSEEYKELLSFFNNEKLNQPIPYIPYVPYPISDPYGPCTYKPLYPGNPYITITYGDSKGSS